MILNTTALSHTQYAVKEAKNTRTAVNYFGTKSEKLQILISKLNFY